MAPLAFTDVVQRQRISGRLYKKGRALFYPVWSYRCFELDVTNQILKWYKCGPTEDTKGVKRGHISLTRATAEVMTDRIGTKRTDIGVKFVISYYSRDRPSTRVNMILSAPTAAEAYKWISYVNKSGRGLENSQEDLEEVDCDTSITPLLNAAPCDIQSSITPHDRKAPCCEPESLQVATQHNIMVTIGIWCCRAVEVMGKMLLFMLWFLAPLYPVLLLPRTWQQLVVYIVALYCVHFLPGTRKMLRASGLTRTKKKDESKVE